jgi:hypothetical protein
MDLQIAPVVPNRANKREALRLDAPQGPFPFYFHNLRKTPTLDHQAP